MAKEPSYQKYDAAWGAEPIPPTPDIGILNHPEDGWWHSGDAGYMDEEGFVYFVERIKDLIIASGYNIAPVEVENHLYKHPAVQEVSVIGVQDAYKAPKIVQFVDELPKTATGKILRRILRDKYTEE